MEFKRLRRNAVELDEDFVVDDDAPLEYDDVILHDEDIEGYEVDEPAPRERDSTRAYIETVLGSTYSHQPIYTLPVHLQTEPRDVVMQIATASYREYRKTIVTGGNMTRDVVEKRDANFQSYLTTAYAFTLLGARKGKFQAQVGTSSDFGARAHIVVKLLQEQPELLHYSGLSASFLVELHLTGLV